MFPTVMLVMNVSSVAVLWFGADRIDDGTLSLGALIAFLSYLTQILMSVMMATFMAVLIPRAAVCAERIQEVLETPSSVARARPRRSPTSTVTARSSCATSSSATRAPTSPVVTGISFTSLPGQTTAIIGSTGSGKTTLINLVPRLFDATVGRSARRRRRRPRPRARRAVEPHRARAAEALPVLGHGGEQPPLRQARRHRGRDVGGARDRPGRATSCGDARRARCRDRAGRHERVGRPAPTAGDRPRARAQAGDLPVRRLVLGARPRHRCAAAGSAGAVHSPTPTVVIVAQRVSTIIAADQILVLEDGTSGRPRHARRAARNVPDLRRDRRVADEPSRSAA